MPAPRGMASQHLWTFYKRVSQNEIYEEVQTKVRLQSKTYVFNNNIERVAPFNRLYGATQCLHLINYLEPLVAPNSWLNGATLSPGWLQIAYPHME